MDLKYSEYIIIGSLVILQVYIAIKLYGKINLYKLIFESLPVVAQKLVSLEHYNNGDIKSILEKEIDPNENNSIEITLLKNKSKNAVFSKVLYQINNYLIKNKGATIDFHLIKDTVDRNIEIIEEDINNRIPAPLYIGLAATMIGIIFGLFLVDFNISNTALNAVQPLIDGVKIAMFASVIGLVITTVFSIKIFKDANYKVVEGKNNFLSQLQSDLMPKMNKSKLPEVEILSNKLDHFARNTSGSILKLDEIVQTTSKTVLREHQLVNDIKSLDISKMTNANIEVFNKVEGMMGSFDKFAKYYNKLSGSMEGTNELLNNLQKFVSSTNNINVILEGIKTNIEQGNKATNFFNNHIQSFSRYGDAVNEAVINADSKMTSAINKLSELTQEQFNLFNNASNDFDSKLSTAFNNSIENFSKAMDSQVIRTEQAFENNRPKFEKLNKLDQLESIDNRLLSLEEKLCNVFINNSKEIISVLKETKSSNNTYSENGKTIVVAASKKSIFESITFVLKFCTYIIIITYSVFSLLKYFKLIS